MTERTVDWDWRLDPPDPLAYECRDCGAAIDGEGWCDACIRLIRAEMRADR